MNSIETICSNLSSIPVATKQMHDFINSLNESDYALLASVFVLGRSGWARDYADTAEYHIFIEEKASEGISVNQQMLDDVFLSKSNKQRQFDLILQYEKSDACKVNGIYKHNWLSNKTNLMTELTKGLRMLQEIR